MGYKIQIQIYRAITSPITILLKNTFFFSLLDLHKQEQIKVGKFHTRKEISILQSFSPHTVWMDWSQY